MVLVAVRVCPPTWAVAVRWRNPGSLPKEKVLENTLGTVKEPNDVELLDETDELELPLLEEASYDSCKRVLSPVVPAGPVTCQCTSNDSPERTCEGVAVKLRIRFAAAAGVGAVPLVGDGGSGEGGGLGLIVVVP